MSTRNPKTYTVTAQWNFDVDGGAISRITLAKNCVIPEGAILKKLSTVVIEDAENINGNTVDTIFKWMWGQNGNTTYDSEISGYAYPNLTYQTAYGGGVKNNMPAVASPPLYANNRARKDMVLKLDISGSSAVKEGVIDIYAEYILHP